MAWHEAEMEVPLRDGTFPAKRLRVTYKIQQGAPAVFAMDYARSSPAEPDDMEVLTARDRETGEQLALSDAQIQSVGDYIIEHHDWDEEPWSPFNREDDRDG
jgi:hypothetical protein